MSSIINNSYKNWHKPIQNKFNESGSLKKGQTHQGYYTCVNKDKYFGDPTRIIFRSGWEKSFCEFCDNSPTILKWSSEPLAIKYYDRVSKLDECKKLGLDPNNPSNWAIKNYYTDFWCVVDKGDNITEKWFIEIKPSNKLKKPMPPANNAPMKVIKRFNIEAKEYLINEAKWAAMNEYAKKNNCKFYVFTEDTLEKLLPRFFNLNKLK